MLLKNGTELSLSRPYLYELLGEYNVFFIYPGITVPDVLAALPVCPSKLPIPGIAAPIKLLTPFIMYNLFAFLFYGAST